MLIISYKSTIEFKNYLDKLNIKFIETTDNPNLDHRIADHPDLSIFALDDDNVLIDESVISYYQAKVTGKNFLAGESVGTLYPHDSIYNVYKGSDFYLHNDTTEKILGLLWMIMVLVTIM